MDSTSERARPESWWRAMQRRWAAFGDADTSVLARAVALLAFIVGVVMLAWRPDPVAACLLIVPMRLGTMLLSSPVRWRCVVGWMCQAAMVAFYGLAIGAAVFVGSFLGWTTPTWVRLATVVTALLVVAGPRLPGRVRWPLLVPLALWTAACVRGWEYEEARVRCDDYLAIRPPVEIVVPTRNDLANCRPGESLAIHRYPRTMWEYPDGRLLITTKLSPDAAQRPGPADTLFEVVCESPPQGTRQPHCVGGVTGRSHGIAPFPDRDRVFVGIYGLPSVRPQDPPLGGRVIEVPFSGPLAVLESHGDYPGNVGGELIGESNDTLLLLGEYEFDSVRVDTADFSRLPSRSIHASPGEVRYDPTRREGVICGAVSTEQMGLVSMAALTGTPPTPRPLIAEPYHPIGRLISWGCDWDPKERKVFAAVPTLGLLARIAYDSGEVEDLSFVGFGMRSVAWDARRRRVYLTRFFRGEIVAVDADSGKEVGRWFVGRFPCQVRLSRDGRSLLAGTTAGVVRIRLDET